MTMRPWLTVILFILCVEITLVLGQTYCDSPTLPTFCLGYRKQQSGRFKFTMRGPASADWIAIGFPLGDVNGTADLVECLARSSLISDRHFDSNYRNSTLEETASDRQQDYSLIASWTDSSFATCVFDRAQDTNDNDDIMLSLSMPFFWIVSTQLSEQRGEGTILFENFYADASTDCATFNEFTSPVFAEYWSSKTESLDSARALTVAGAAAAASCSSTSLASPRTAVWPSLSWPTLAGRSRLMPQLPSCRLCGTRTPLSWTC